MKLYTVVDQGPTGRHIDDLRALHPTADELEFAAAWCRSQDPSPAFAQVLAEAVRFLSSGQADDSA